MTKDQLLKIIWEAAQRGDTELDLGGERLDSLPEEFGQLTSLSSLDLRRTHLESLPKSLGQLTKLTYLDLSNNNLGTLPAELDQLTYLTYLDLSDNSLTELTKRFGQLSSLNQLYLSQNELKSLPKNFGQLKKLTYLDLTSNHFVSLPKTLGQLINLTHLNLNSNKLTRLPKELGQLVNLNSLNVAGNQLVCLPEILVQLTKLNSLNCAGNGLTSLPKGISQLINLTELGLGSTFSERNRFTSLPEEFGQLTNLTRLDLSGNQLTSLPEEFGQLTNLTRLDLSGNQLTSLPEEFGQLTNLTWLDLSGNRLTSLPDFFDGLVNLNSLNLQDNPLNVELSALEAQGKNAILQYLRERAKESLALYEAKLILVGEGAVGKSSLLGALRGDAWIENRDTTHGIETRAVCLEHPSVTNVEITLNAWDFGGQPIYRPTHQLFFSSPAIYLIVWKPREGPEQGFVEYWSRLIKHRAYDINRPDERPRILVVATHGGPKERQAYIDEIALGDQFSEVLVSFHHVDSKTGAGIDELKAEIARVASTLPGMGRKVAASYKRTREALSNIREPYLSYSNFARFCLDRGLDQSQTKLFASMSHELGHFIHYGNDESLKDIVILKADWLSKAISFAFEDEQVKKQSGLVTHRHLGQLWNDLARPQTEQYDPSIHPIFLRLMERFDLTYRVIESGTHAEPTSLIAQLVPGNRPQQLSEYWKVEPNSNEIQRAQVCRIVDANTGLPGMAEGILYQLIVRLHRYSLGRKDNTRNCHWQRGLILDDTYNGRAFLELIGNDIRITVRATYPQYFLQHLSEEVKWLVENFWKGLRCQITVPCQQPCGKNEPGLGLFEISKLIESRNRGRPEYPCPIPDCDEWQNIDTLLSQAPSSTSQDFSILLDEKLASQSAEMRRGQVLIYRAVQNNYQELHTDLKILMSQADEQFSKLMAELADDARDAPRLYSIIPNNAEQWAEMGWAKIKVRVTLWCAHSRLPVPQLANNSKCGSYLLEQPREWLLRVAPYAKFTARILSLILPVARSVAQWSLDDPSYKAIEENLDLGQKSFNALLQASGDAGNMLMQGEKGLSNQGGLSNLYGESKQLEGIPLRLLQERIRQEDPYFGGLKRVQDRRRQFLWVHPKYHEIYNPELPEIPQDR